MGWWSGGQGRARVVAVLGYIQVVDVVDGWVCCSSYIPVVGRVNFWCMFYEVPVEGSQCL